LVWRCQESREAGCIEGNEGGRLFCVWGLGRWLRKRAGSCIRST